MANRKVNWTTQRRVIYDIVQSSDSHPTANDVMEMLRDSNHQFAYGTIYNSLRYLVDMGLVRELKLGDAVSRYDARIEDHMHLICDVCGCVAETAISLPEEWMQEIEKQTQFHLESPEILLHGVCVNCQSTQKEQ